MAAKRDLGDFVHDALSAGRSRNEIRAALGDGGWSVREIEGALAAYADTSFTPPVPRPTPHLSARDAFFYAVLFTALAFSASFLITLIHTLLTLWMPDARDSDWMTQQLSSQARWAIAVLVVAGPVYVWMTMRAARLAAADPGHRRSLVRKWLTYLALFISAMVVFGDATYVIYNFLEGELTLRFVLKALTVAAVAGGIFLFYLKDVEGDADAG